MSLLLEDQPSSSPLIETVARSRTLEDGSTTRPAENQCHLVLVTYRGQQKAIITGPWTTAGIACWEEGAEIVWVKLKPGTFFPSLPFESLLDHETMLPEASSRSFWLQGSAWQVPDVEHVDVFINRLVREELLIHDPLVTAVLQGHPSALSPRTVRHRFLNATGMSHNNFYQIERAGRAASLLRQGRSVSDIVFELGYFDQPHLTRALRRWVGQTPAQLVGQRKPR